MKTDKVDMREKTNDCKELYTLHFLGFEKYRAYLKKRKTIFKTIAAKNKRIEQFLKSVKWFSDKNCGKNKELEQSIEPGETKTAPGHVTKALRKQKMLYRL